VTLPFCDDDGASTNAHSPTTAPRPITTGPWSALMGEKYYFYEKKKSGSSFISHQTTRAALHRSPRARVPTTARAPITAPAATETTPQTTAPGPTRAPAPRSTRGFCRVLVAPGSSSSSSSSPPPPTPASLPPALRSPLWLAASLPQSLPVSLTSSASSCYGCFFKCFFFSFHERMT
jgi:hypothetical protein